MNKSLGAFYEAITCMECIKLRVFTRQHWKMSSNCAFKPTAEQALGINRGIACRGGLTRR